MSKKLFLIVGLFFLVIVLFFTLVKQPENPSLRHQKQPLAQISPTTVLQSTLSFAQNPIITTRGATTSADIIFTSQGSFPQTLQLEMQYDPTILTNMMIVPGELFPEATILLNTVNPSTGRISYALEVPKQTKGEVTGILATLIFLPSNFAWEEETYLNFLPKTNVKGKTEINALESGYGTRIIIRNE